MVDLTKRGEGKCRAVDKAQKLLIHTLKICSSEKNFPKRYRWCLTNKIVDLAIDIANEVNIANQYNLFDKRRYLKRKSHQFKAVTLTYALEVLIDTAYKFFGAGSFNVNYWADLIRGLRRTMSNWQESDERRREERMS